MKWGERSEHEFIKKEMLEFVANFLDVNPSLFQAQYEEAYGADIDAEELAEEVQNLRASSQPKPKRKPRAPRVQQMEVDSESD